jgi:methyl-accepting chemotaxis protein
MRHLTLKQKLWIPMVLCWISLLIVTVANAFDARGAQMRVRLAGLADVVDMSASIVADYARAADAGKLSVDEAQRQAIARIDAQRYGTSGYVSIVRDDKVLIDNPLSPKLNGKDMSQFRDAMGSLLYQEIVEAGNLGKGSGALHYWWPKPGESRPSEKVSFVKGFAPWHWNLIAGEYMDDIQAQFYATLARSAALLAVLGGIASFVAMRVGRNVYRSIGGEPSAAATIVAQIAQGHLATDIVLAPGDRSSLLFSLREMRDQLAGAVRHILVSTETIAGASKEIASGNLDLSSRTQQQAASLKQTTASMEELTETVRRNADSAQSASELAAGASDIAMRGGRAVDDMAGKMKDISNSSHKMGEFIGVIEGIAFQTNILALNAAVEAARAGDEGRGFAVVAGEVRQLAQRCAGAAKEIKALIGQSAAHVDEELTLAADAGATMNEVVDAVRRLASIVGEISDVSKHQSARIGEVNVAIRGMDDMTERNAALVERAAAAAGSLDYQAERLQQSVSAFRVEPHGVA